RIVADSEKYPKRRDKNIERHRQMNLDYPNAALAIVIAFDIICRQFQRHCVIRFSLATRPPPGTRHFESLDFQ
ncbi:hypothetical protein, partial [Burkholderia mallei]|uniref:hypothetical protein n=1 Tax=Burkholderia mallei TaxID=13373 RepID=UPI001C4A68F5